MVHCRSSEQEVMGSQRPGKADEGDCISASMDYGASRSSRSIEMEISKPLNACHTQELDFVMLCLAEVRNEVIHSHGHCTVVVEHECVGATLGRGLLCRCDAVEGKVVHAHTEAIMSTQKLNRVNSRS